METIISYDSHEAASYRTDIKGWVSRHGRYCGDAKDSERIARYNGCTHWPCTNCGELTKKCYTICQDCRIQNDIDTYQQRERKPWDGHRPLYAESCDQYFFDFDALQDYCEEHSLTWDDLRLHICEPVYYTLIDPMEIYHYIFQEDCGEVAPEIEAAFEELNAKIAACKEPASWYPGEFAADMSEWRT